VHILQIVLPTLQNLKFLALDIEIPEVALGYI
jgi:hypothetical protein